MKNSYVLLITVVMACYWINLNGQSAPRQGEILITEIMVNPEAVSDANGEWIEIWNATDRELLLNGMTLKDAGSNQHILASAEKLVLPAHAYWVLAKNGDKLTNGGISPDYVYQNFTLSNTADQIILIAPDELLIDQVGYSAGWPVISGSSMELHPDYQSFSGNDQPEHWFPARMIFGSGDKGSPGQANPLTSGLEEWEQEIRVDIFPNPTTGPFILEATFPKPQSGEIRIINLLGENFAYKTFAQKEVLREIIQPGFLTPGIWFVEIISGNKSKTVRLVVEN